MPGQAAIKVGFLSEGFSLKCIFMLPSPLPKIFYVLKCEWNLLIVP